MAQIILNKSMEYSLFTSRFSINTFIDMYRATEPFLHTVNLDVYNTTKYIYFQ